MPADLHAQGGLPVPPQQKPAPCGSLRAAVLDKIHQTIDFCDGDLEDAAKLLAVPLAYVRRQYRILYGVDPPG